MPAGAVLPEARRLASLCHHRWAIPVLDALHRETSLGRVAPLIHSLEVTRPSLRRTIDGLVELGFVRWNPGYGHPLRPELLLSDLGRELGPWCTRVLALADDSHARHVVLRKWALAVLAALHVGRERFGEIHRALGSVTPRALNQTLTQLTGEGLVTRVVYDETPPSVRYGLAASGKRLAKEAQGVPRPNPPPVKP